MSAAWRYRWLVVLCGLVFGALGYLLVVADSGAEWTAEASIIVARSISTSCRSTLRSSDVPASNGNTPGSSATC